MYQSATVIWFDILKGIGEAKSNKNGKTIFINAAFSFKNTSDSFKLKEGASIVCKTNKSKEGNLFSTNLKLV